MSNEPDPNTEAGAPTTNTETRPQSPITLEERHRQRRRELWESGNSLIALQAYAGTTITQEDLFQSINLSSFLNLNGDITDAETDRLITLAQTIKEIIITEDDIGIVYH